MTFNAGSPIAPFPTSAVLIDHATKMLQATCDGLKKDVDHCLVPPYAPFPAMLFCFSIIDFMGALTAGRGDSYRPVTTESTVYMQRFMKYADPVPDLLLRIFRHRLVHLAAPKIVLEYKDGKGITHRAAWMYSHNTQGRHLSIEGVHGHVNGENGLWSLEYDQTFWLDITAFTNDIINSILQPGGYLEQLNINPVLQENYAKTFNDLYDPKK